MRKMSTRAFSLLSSQLRPFLARTATVLPRSISGRLRTVSSWGKFSGGFQQESGESTAGGGRQRWGAFLLGVAASGGVGLLAYQHRHRESGRGSSPLAVLPELQAAEEEKSEQEKEEEKLAQHERRKQRFKLFSSYVYKGEPYMSPRDFLESITQDDCIPHEQEFLDDKMVSHILKRTPSRSKGSSHLFRDMWDKGILSYGDYLFLITALIKSKRQFEVAFKMIDVDQSDYIDLQEFSRIQEAVTKQKDSKEQKLPNTSLSIFLFGTRGNQRLYSTDFFKFIEDLQTEVREIEFNKYSGGSPTISEEDFARVLLRHTAWDLDPVFDRLRTRLRHRRPGITFQQFCDFCQLLNTLDDFAIAMTMFTITGKAVTEEEFGRAAHVCIGVPLDEAFLGTVFQIFDVDGDGKLSYREFLAVMKNWKLRGFKMKEQKRQGAWAEFKTCVKLEMKNK